MSFVSELPRILFSCCQVYLLPFRASTNRVSNKRKLSLYENSTNYNFSKSSACKKCEHSLKQYGKPSACECCNIVAAFGGPKCQRFVLNPLYHSPFSIAKTKEKRKMCLPKVYGPLKICFICKFVLTHFAPKNYIYIIEYSFCLLVEYWKEQTNCFRVINFFFLNQAYISMNESFFLYLFANGSLEFVDDIKHVSLCKAYERKHFLFTFLFDH